MIYSQNGYSSDAKLMAVFTVPGTAVKLTLRQGDASVVLLYVAELFNKTVEKLVPAQCGGYNPRSIIGSSTPSNHASGTAEDLNWSKHARGAHGTFTAGQKTAVRKILAFLNADAKVVRWGEDYVSAPVDGMHFEIVATPAQLRAAADRVRAWRARGTTTGAKTVKHPAGSRTLKSATPVMTGDDVTFVQRFIGAKRCGAADGKYGPATISGVRWYQGMRGIPVTGRVDAKTWAQLGVNA